MLTPDAIAQFRRDGFIVLPRVMGPASVTACLAALGDLAAGRRAIHTASITYEDGIDPAAIPPDARTDHIRKFMDFVDDLPELRMAAMNRALHAALDQLMGQGRVLFQEMALLKPPHIGGEKTWHQDAAYFRIADPTQIIGVWIALDPALAINGCMEVVPGSHLLGPVPHAHENDINRCTIDAAHLNRDARVKVEMQPGDALVFSSLLHHYTAANRSNLRRRAVQFHYHQTGAVWTGFAAHHGLFHHADGSYGGCTTLHPPLPDGIGPEDDVVRAGKTSRAIVETDPLD